MERQNQELELMLMQREDHLSMKLEKHYQKLRFREKDWSFPTEFPHLKQQPATKMIGKTHISPVFFEYSPPNLSCPVPQ